MHILGIMFRPLYWLAGKLLALWVRPAIQPESPEEIVTGDEGQVCYVLETGGLVDLLTLEPTEAFDCCGQRFSRRYVVLRPVKGLFVRRTVPSGSARLRELVAAAGDHGEQLLLIPVAIYWGRSPDKENSFFKLLQTLKRLLTAPSRRYHHLGTLPSPICFLKTQLEQEFHPFPTETDT